MTLAKKLAVLMIAASAASGCAIARTSYVTPNIQAPEVWRYGSQSQSVDAAQTTVRASDKSSGFQVETDAWWTAFNDEGLDRFITSVLASNNDLAAAALAARRAALQARLTAAELGPQVSAGADAETNTDGDQSYSASAGLSYEIDLWGALDASRDAAIWEARASDEDRQAVALSLTGSAATLYWQLAYLNVRVVSAEESLSYAERTLELVETQYRAGAVSGLERAESQQTVYTQRAALTELTQTRVETRNAIALLRDGERVLEEEEPAALPSEVPALAEGLPAELLSRRPDLRAAEMRLRATLASGDATRLSYYPAINLTASGGGSSTSLNNVLANPIGSLAASLALPFLQANEMQLASRVTDADYEKAVVEFRQSLRVALIEVEDALSARRQLAAKADEVDAALSAARTAERIYELRYRAGAGTLRDWLDAQERRREAELSVNENAFNQLSNQVDLYLALGGGVET